MLKMQGDYWIVFEVIYGRHFISHNIHGLMHLCDDYDEFGPLDNCSAFSFEDYMGSLKKMLRKPHTVKCYNMETILNFFFFYNHLHEIIYELDLIIQPKTQNITTENRHHVFHYL